MGRCAKQPGAGVWGASWQSAPGLGLYCSLVLKSEASALSLRAGLAVARAVEEVTELPIECKWPNDVLCRGRKIGGILCEAREGKTVVGIGLNVNQKAQDLPDRPIFPASSLLLESGRAFSVDELLEAITGALETVLHDENWRVDYENRMFGRGEIARANGTIGVVTGVSESGSLRLQSADGPREIVAGDLEWV